MEYNLTNIDKQLVTEGKLEFVRNNDTQSLFLTDDGKIEHYNNGKLIETTNFSKIGIQRESKLILQEGYSLTIKQEAEIKDVNNEEEIDLEQEEQNLNDDIEQINKLQDLKDEFQQKVDNFLNESKTNDFIELDQELDRLIAANATDKELNDFLEEASYNEVLTNEEYRLLQKKAQDTRRIDESKQEVWVIKNNKTNRYLSDKDDFEFYWVNNPEDAKKFSSYEDVFDYIDRESRFGNSGAEYWEELQLNESCNLTKSKSILETKTPKELKNINLNQLTEVQKKWIETNIGSLKEVQQNIKDFGNTLTESINENKPVISLYEYLIETKAEIDKEGLNNG